jgi:hypothetical protein
MLIVNASIRVPPPPPRRIGLHGDDPSHPNHLDDGLRPAGNGRVRYLPPDSLDPRRIDRNVNNFARPAPYSMSQM